MQNHFDRINRALFTELLSGSLGAVQGAEKQSNSSDSHPQLKYEQNQNQRTALMESNLHREVSLTRLKRELVAPPH